MSRKFHRRDGDSEWFGWVMIVLLFAVGLTPVALILLFVKLFGSDGKKKSAQGAKADSRNPKAMKAPQTKDSNATVLQVIGAVLLAVGLLACINPIDRIIWRGTNSYYVRDILYALAVAAAGGALLSKGTVIKQALQRYKRYLVVLGDRDTMQLKDISAVTGYPRRRVIQDLEKMIEKGFFGGAAYLHMELDCFCRTAGAAEAQREVQAAECVPLEAEEGYSGILRGIRRANDRIADPVLSQKIDRLEEITAAIFRAVEDDPSKQRKIATFLNYYLPTTQKLLDAYAEFEAAGVEGENLRQAKQRIETTMDSILEGFEHKLDALYHADAMDVDSEIRVMETMLRRDRASVEEDFGLNTAAACCEEDCDVQATYTEPK